MAWLQITHHWWHIIIMYNKRKNILVLLIFCFLFALVPVKAQEDDNLYKLNAFLGVGYNRFISGLNEEGLNKNGFNGTFRIMWSPEYLLRVGLESGYIKLFSVNVNNMDTDFGKTYLRTSMSAVPIFIMWSMDLGKKVDINIGTGGYLLYSSVDSFGNKVTSTEFSNGYIISLTYLTNLYHDLDVGVELKWDYINKIGNELRFGSLNRLSDGHILIQLILKYQFLEW
jgi:hypothetical protein